MGSIQNNKPSLVRLGAFAAVLLLTAGLLVTLFQEAQGSEWNVDDIGSVSGTATITAEIVVPDGDALPIVSISGVIENNEAGLTTKQGHIDVGEPVEIATCESATVDCASGDLERTPTGVDAFSAIRFAGAFRADNDAEITDGFFDTDGGAYSFAGAYGVHDDAGFGYSGEHPGGAQTSTSGYGYAASDLVLKYEFDVQTGNLGSGDYWFTAVADTGSGVIAGLQSAAKSFTVTSTSSGPGSGGGSDDDDDDPDPTDIVDAIELTDLPEGALEGWRAIITGNAGDTIRINTGSDRVPRVDFTLSEDVENAEVDIYIFPTDTPPEGTPVASWRGAFIVQITISTGGTDHTVKIYVELGADEMEEGDENNTFGAKHENPWVPQSKIELTLDEDTSRYAGSFSASCCSVYMVGFDEEDPTVSLSPLTSPLSGTVTLEAEVDDDVQVDRVEFYAGDALLGTATEAPYTQEWDTTSSTDGEYSVRAVAYDFIGNEAEDNQTIEVQQADDDSEGGPSGEGGSSFPWWLIILIALVVIGGAIWYATSQKKQK